MHLTLAFVEDTLPSHAHPRSSQRASKRPRYMPHSTGSGTEVLLGLPYTIAKTLPTLPYRSILCAHQGYMQQDKYRLISPSALFKEMFSVLSASKCPCLPAPASSCGRSGIVPLSVWESF